MQERIAFPGPKRPLPEPSEVGVDNAEKVRVETSDGVELRGWWLRPDSAAGPAPALIWFYGNFETVSVLAPVIHYLKPPEWGLLALDIRGYGESGGSIGEDGFYLDAEAGWDFPSSRPEVDPNRIAVFGRSLGTALAMHLAASRPVAAVILEAPFTSAKAMARAHYPFVPSFAVRLQLDNEANAKKLAAPLLVVHGSDDTIVPVEMGRTIAEVGRAEAMIVFDGAGHNDLLMGDAERYREEWQGFLESVVERRE